MSNPDRKQETFQSWESPSGKKSRSSLQEKQHCLSRHQLTLSKQTRRTVVAQTIQSQVWERERREKTIERERERERCGGSEGEDGWDWSGRCKVGRGIHGDSVEWIWTLLLRFIGPPPFSSLCPIFTLPLLSLLSLLDNTAPPRADRPLQFSPLSKYFFLFFFF